MNQLREYEVGDKVLYDIGEGWKKGVVHGKKQFENNHGIIKSVTYLIDTGGNTRVDVKVSDRNGRKLGIIYNQELAKMKPKDRENIAKRAELSRNIISKHPELAKPDLYNHEIRQPEQVECLPEQLKPL